MAPGISTQTTDSQAAAAALRREIRQLDKGNAQLRKDVEEAKVQLSNEVLLRVMADKHCEQEQATLSHLRKELQMAKGHVSRNTSEIQSHEGSISMYRSIMTEHQSSMVDASLETKDTSTKSHQVPSSSQSGSAKNQARGRGRSPGAAKKQVKTSSGYGGSASTGEVHAGPTAPDASAQALDNPKDKLVVENGSALGSPGNASGNQAEAEMPGHVTSTSEGLGSVVDSMTEPSNSVSVAAQTSKVEKTDGGKHYTAVLATRPHHTDVRKYLF